MAKSYSSIKAFKVGKSFEQEKERKSYKDIKSSEYDFGVDDEYIKSFYNDFAKYSSDAEKDYNGITYGSDVAGLYDKYSSQSADIRDRASTIRAYLNSQKSNLDNDAYSKLIDSLDSSLTFADDTSNAFKDRKDFYTTFETKYDYDAFVMNNTEGAVNGKAQKRNEAYNSVSKRIAEIDGELSNWKYDNKPTMTYNSDGQPIVTYEPTPVDQERYNKLKSEKDKLEAEARKYEHGNKKTDELFSQYFGNEDWEEDSQNRDFNRPNERDLAQYGSAYNIDTGERYDIDESVVTMEDPLGTYLAFRNGEDGYQYGLVQPPSLDLETEKETRASQHTDAYNLAIEKGQSQHWEHLTNDEVNLYYYMLSNGLKDQAVSYLYGMETELDRRASVEYQKGLEEASALEMVFHNVVSIPANIVGGAAAFVDDAINLAIGNEINPYDGGHAIQNYAQGVRTATANDINKLTGASEDDFLTWGDAYQGLMSGADSVVGSLALGGGYTILMGMGGAASEAKELYEKGASKEQMIAGGILAGAAEAAFEKISVGYFLDDVLGKPAKHVGQWLYKTLGMAGVEASEEFCTTLANYISDASVMGSQSDWATMINQYTKAGYSEGQAIWKAIKDIGGEALRDAAVGAISGGGMGVVGNTISAVQYNKSAKTYGQQIIDAGGVDTLKNLALDMAGEQKGIRNFANKRALKQYAKSSANGSAGQVGRLADTVDSTTAKQNKADLTAELQEKGVAEFKAKEYVDALFEMNDGKSSAFTLGTKEQWKKLTGDDKAYDMLRNILTDEKSSVNIRNLAVGNAKRGIRVDAEGKLNEADVAAYQERQTTKLIQAIAEANGIQKDIESDFDVSEDGKTYVNTNDGSIEVTSKEFIDSEDGTLKVKVNGDQEVDTSSVSYGNMGEALVVSAIVDMGVGAEDANTLYNMFEGVDAKTGQAYANGISLAFKYGRYFYSPGKLNSIVGISKKQAQEAFRIGRESRSKDTKAAQAKLDATAEANTKEGKKVSSKGSVVYEGVIADENGNLATEEVLTDIQKASVNGLKLIAELSPINFHLFQSEKDGDTYTYVKKNGEETHANGWYRVGTNDIYIDLNAGVTGEGTVMYTAAHEISHFIKEYSPEKWDKIAEYIMNEYCSHYGGKVDALLMKHIVAIQNRSDAKTKTQQEIEDEAFEDLVCDSLSKMLIDGTVVKAMTNIKQKDKGAWNTIKKAVQNLLEKWGVVIDQYKGRNPDAEEAGYFNETSKAFRKLQRMMTEAFVDAGDTYSKVGNLKTEQSEVLSDRATAEESKAIKSLGKDATVERNENGDMLVATNKDGSTVMYSERTWRMGGKDKFIATMTALGHGDQAQTYAKYLDDALGYLHELAVGYEILGQHLDADIVTDIKNGKQVLSAIVNNGEYPVNIDLALICKKRVAYMRLMAKMIEDGVFGDVKYDGDAIAEVNKILRKNGFETACLGCFVESRRLQFQTWAETIVQEWNEAVEARNKYAHYFRFADGKASLTDEEIDAIDKELSTGKKNAKGNLNLGQGSVANKMSRLLDKVPSLARKLTVDDLLTPQGLTALRATDANLFSLVKQRYGAASPKIVQDYNPYASEIADLTFNFVKKVTGNNVKGAKEYILEAKKELGVAPVKQKGESKEDFKNRKAEYDAKVEALAMQKYLYSIGGARIQSFSDFMIENVFDYLQIFADLAAKELPMHGYTKEIVAIRLFGMSGAKWNGSLIAHVDKSMGKEYAGLLPASEAKNGNGILVKVDGKEYCIGFDDYARNKATSGDSFIQSIGMKDIVALMYDPRYSPYVGNITIGVSDKQIMAMLDSPLFRMVIPYHASGMLPQFAQLVGVDMYNDYTNYQNTTVKNIRLLNDADYTVKVGDNGKPKVVKNADGKDVGIDTHYAFNKMLQKYGDARKTCNDYLAWCRNEHPIYDKGKVIGYATFNAKFSDSPTGVDFTKHRNYYKLIEDFNTYDNITEKPAQQGAVTMNFPSAENRLTAEQKKAYEKALRDTGIFSEADIKKYLEKADMTFEEIVRAEVGNRKAYNDATEPKFDSTVKEVEDYLLNAKDDKGNYKFRRDSIADTASDYIEAKNHGISLKPATGSYSADEKLSDRKSGLATYDEAQYNAFGWASYNNFITANERETLLSRFADFKHNRNKYPVTRWGEAVIHSTECPDVIMYVRASSTIDVPEITRIVRVEFDDIFDIVDLEAIQREVIFNEQERILQPYESVELIYGEEVFRTHKKRDSVSFQEYLSREEGRDSGTSVFDSKGLQVGEGSGRGSHKGNREYGSQVKESSRRDSGKTLNAMEMEKRIFELRDEIEDINEQMEWLDYGDAEYRTLNNARIKAQYELDKLVAEEGKATVKTPLNEIISNLSKYRISDLYSIAEQFSDSAWDDYEDLSRDELESVLREALGLSLKENGESYLYVRPVEEKQSKIVQFPTRASTVGDALAEEFKDIQDTVGNATKYKDFKAWVEAEGAEAFAEEIVASWGTDGTASSYFQNLLGSKSNADNADLVEFVADVIEAHIQGNDSNIRYSDRDSTGRTLTEAQQEFFKDSKVRDAEGNLMPVYHGTPTGGFTTFEMPHYLSTLMSAQGAGFYFTDKANAKQYMKPRNGKADKNRQLYEVYLNITNPMEIEPYSTGHITDQQMRDIFARGNYEWGVAHTDVEKEIRINKWDSDRLASLVKVFNGDAVLDAMKDVLGYDGVRYTDKYGDIWVAWEQSQIKNTTNLNPTKDPDIRYSDRVIPTGVKLPEGTNMDKNGKPRSAQAQRDAGYLLSESKFYQLYSAHKLNFGTKSRGLDVNSVIEKIKRDGFISSTANANVLPTATMRYFNRDADGNVKYSNVVQARYAPRKGDYVLFVPNNYVTRDDIIKNGFKPLDYEIAMVEYDYQPYYELYTKAYDSVYDGKVMYQDRGSISSRAMLANALESTIDSSTPEGQIELAKLKEYKEMANTLDELSVHLNNLRGQLFSKGVTGEDRKKIQAEATKTANRISVYDKKLLNLESTKPIKRLLDREKAQAAKKQRKIDAENLASYRETRAKSEARVKLQQLVLKTSKWISYPKKGEVKCPDILRAPYADFLNGIDMSSKRLLNGGEQTKNDLRMATAMDSLATAIQRIKDAQNPAIKSDEVLDSGYLDLPAFFVEKLREMAEKTKGLMIEGDYVVNRMSSAEIKQLTNLIRTLNHSIKEMSTLYSNLRFAIVEELGDDTISFMEEIGEIGSTNMVKDFVAWDNALPYYAFKRFGNGGESVFEELMDAQDKMAYLAQSIMQFREKAWDSKESKAWSEDTHTLELPSGKTITLTTADAMSIYCLSRRDNDQGLNHLLGGGVRVLGEKKGATQAKDSRVMLDFDDVMTICNSLDDRPRAVAESIQEFMSTVCSEWGNEISMKRFLTKDFIEKRYFPIQSNDEVLSVKDPQAQQSDLYRLLNISATKPLTPNANNSVIIRNIFDVFTEHTSDMARLNAYGMALLDYMKWVNYNEVTKNEKGQLSVRGVRGAMHEAYGDKARSYVIGLIKDINGRANDNGDHPLLMKMTRTAKTAAVGSSLRVAALQFTSYPRAAMVLSTANLAKGLSKRPQISKAKQYCGVALWKSFGFYDTNIARSIEDQIKGTTDWKQKLIELSLKGAEWGDSITWGYLWNACEYDVATSNKQLKVGTEEFNQAVGKRLREVVYATQVVDSVLTRSSMMRSKSGLTQTATAFMSEPTLTHNILMDAGFQFSLEKRRTGNAKAAWKKCGGHICKAVTVFGVSQVITALVESLIDAYRDDDDEEFLDKFGEAMLQNLVTDIIPFNKIPILADMVEGLLSLFGIGYFSSDRLDMTWLTDIKKALESWVKVLGEAFGVKDTSITTYKALYDTVKALSSTTGVPLSGLLREIITLWNNTAGAVDPELKVKKYEE